MAAQVLPYTVINLTLSWYEHANYVYCIDAQEILLLAKTQTWLVKYTERTTNMSEIFSTMVSFFSPNVETAKNPTNNTCSSSPDTNISLIQE